jgi:hypothetical protein
MMCKAFASGVLVAAGCTVGAPPGFSAGENWTFPLVGPLENGLLITPATVKGHGPYLFAIDPDAGRGLELLLGVTSSSGKAMAPLIVELPRGVDQLSNPVPPDYAGATIAVLDVSPFTRPCAGDGGCIVVLDDAPDHRHVR